MGATPSTSVKAEAEIAGEKFQEYKEFCRYELMKHDLRELAKIFLGPYGVKTSDLDSIISDFVPRDLSEFKNRQPRLRT